MKKNNKKGFTLVELVIVIAVIAILAAVLIPTFGSVINNAKKSSIEQEAHNLQIAVMAEAKADLDKYCSDYVTANKTASGSENNKTTVKGDDFIEIVASENKDSYKGDKFKDYIKELSGDITIIYEIDASRIVYQSGDYYVTITATKITLSKEDPLKATVEN